MVHFTKKFQKSHPELIFLKADKGNATVVMYKHEYNEKLLSLLDDRNTYDILKKDPTLSHQKKVNDYIKNLLYHKYINKKTADQLSCTNGQIPRLYGAPKIHKEGAPLRPIVSFVNGPSYNFAKYVAKILDCSLRPAFQSQNNNSLKHPIKDSIDLIHKMRHTSIPQDHELVSFDVISMFNNI